MFFANFITYLFIERRYDGQCSNYRRRCLLPNIPHQTGERDIPHQTGGRDITHQTAERDITHQTGERDITHQTGERDVPHQTGGRDFSQILVDRIVFFRIV